MLSTHLDAKTSISTKSTLLTLFVNFLRFFFQIKYLGFEAEDDPGYNMIQHFDRAYDFIEDARKHGGRVLVHCLMGINRSGLIAVTYIMKQKHIGPITAALMAKKQRGLILTNDGFQSQLIHFANQKGLLELDKNEL